MLYGEFLEGTNKADNAHTYSEYKRIEKIYNNDNTMTKEDAYRMYEEPSDLIQQLMADLEDAREQASDNAVLAVKLEAELKATKAELQTEHNKRVSLEWTLHEATQAVHKAYYTLTD